MYCRQLSGGAVPRARAVGKIPDIWNASSYLEYYNVMLLSVEDNVVSPFLVVKSYSRPSPKISLGAERAVDSDSAA